MNDVVVAIAAVLQALATIALVILTGRYAKSTRELVEVSVRPRLVVHETIPNELVDPPSVRLSNVGSGPAVNVKMTISGAEFRLDSTDLPPSILEANIDRPLFPGHEYVIKPTPRSQIGRGDDSAILAWYEEGEYEASLFNARDTVLTFTYASLDGSNYNTKVVIGDRSIEHDVNPDAV